MGVFRLAGMKLERVRNWFWSLGKFDSLVALLIVTVLSMLLFRLPMITHYRGIYFNEILQYGLIILVGIFLIAMLRPPTIALFGRPRIRWVGLFAIVIAGVMVTDAISNGYIIQQPLRVKIAGTLFLLTIGLGEELMDRVLIFGTLQRFGTTFAVIASSVIFGLTHINVYLPEWDGWSAYCHVMSATGFGLLACGIYLATRSFWVVAIFHALVDWTVVFDKLHTYGGEEYSPGILEGLRWGVEDFAFEYGLLGLILLCVLRGRWPKWILWLAVKSKLVEQAEGRKNVSVVA